MQAEDPTNVFLPTLLNRLRRHKRPHGPDFVATMSLDATASSRAPSVSPATTTRAHSTAAPASRATPQAVVQVVLENFPPELTEVLDSPISTPLPLGMPTPLGVAAPSRSADPAAAHPVAQLATIGQIGRYALKRELGQGGLGQVHEAWDPLLSRTVAIKTLQLDERHIGKGNLDRMFLNEARAIAGLSHPHIVTVYDAGLSAQGVYIAMERLHGADLRHRLADGWRPSPTQAAQLVRRVADALAYAHVHGVVHCDIKPANIFLSPRGKPKVLDFGIAHIANGQSLPVSASRHSSPGAAWAARLLVQTEGAARVGDGPLQPTPGGPERSGPNSGGYRAGNSAGSAADWVAGSPLYLAPEQLTGRGVDARTDVYALGVVFYELLTGRRPFAGKSVEDIARAVLTQFPLAAHEVRPDVPMPLSAIVARAMERDPAHRYASASELAHDIRRWHEQAGGDGVDSQSHAVHLVPEAEVSGSLPPPAVTVVVAPAPVPWPDEAGATPQVVTDTAARTLAPSWRWIAGASALATATLAVWIWQPPQTPPAAAAAPATTAIATASGQRLPQESSVSPQGGPAMAPLAGTQAGPNWTTSQAPSAPVSAPVPAPVSATVSAPVSAAASAPLAETPAAAPRTVVPTPTPAPAVARERNPVATKRDAQPTARARDAAGGQTALVPMLVPTPVPAPVPALAPPGRTTGAAAATAGAQATAQSAAASGWVLLAISPWGLVEVDGKAVGTTPPMGRVRLAAGRHTITVRNADFAPHVVIVQVQPDQPTLVRHRFNP